MFKLNFNTDALLEVFRKLADLPNRIKSGLTAAVNMIGEALVEEVVDDMSAYSGLSAPDIRSQMTITEATDTNQTFEMDASLVVPDPTIWARPWTARGRQPFDSNVLVNIVTAGDDKVCPICVAAARNNPYTFAETNKMFAKWAHTLVPGLLHPNAVLEGSTFASYGKVREIVSAVFDGPAVRLTTTVGEITIGVNHPMLTGRGWVRASEITESDNLVYDLRTEVSVVHPNFKDMPSIEEVEASGVPFFRSFGGFTVSHNFHGDRVFCKGKVKVVRPTGELLLVFDPCGIEVFGYDPFARTYMELFFKSSLRSFNSFLLGMNPISNSIMCGLRKCLSFFRAEISPVLLEISGIRDSVCRSDLGLALFGAHSIPSFSSSSQGAYSSFNNIVDLPTRKVDLFSDYRTRKSTLIELDQSIFQLVPVKRKRFVSFHGMAYDASTDTGLYNSSGFVVKNCRCTLEPTDIGGRKPFGTGGPSGGGVRMPSGLLNMRRIGSAIADQITTAFKK